MDTVEQLARAPIFADLPLETVRSLSEQGRTLEFESGHRLFMRGEDADALMIVLDGVVALYFPVEILGATREITLETKQPGDVVAWSALVNPFQFTVSARCATPCRVLSLTRETMRRCFEAAPSAGYLFMRNLAAVIGNRLQAMQTVWVQELRAAAARRLE